MLLPDPMETLQVGTFSLRREGARVVVSFTVSFIPHGR